MAITTVKATINGQTYTLTHSSGNTWTATLTLDTSVPHITAASIAPNPADTGETMVLTVTVEES